MEADGNKADDGIFMTQELPAMTGAELMCTREFLGIDRKWLADRLVINDRRLARMEAGKESIPDAVVSELDEIMATTTEIVRRLTAEYRRKVKSSGGDDVPVATYRLDTDYSGQDMEPGVQQQLKDLRADIAGLERNLRKVDALRMVEPLITRRGDLRRLAAEHRRRTEFDLPGNRHYNVKEAERLIDEAQRDVDDIEEKLRMRDALKMAEELTEKRVELTRTQYPSRWHRMLWARVSYAAPGLILVYE
jgi:hypothetical protein